MWQFKGNDMTISPNLALNLTDEQLLTISAVTEVVDQYLADNFKANRSTIVRHALIYDLFNFEAKVLNAFIRSYTDAGWQVTKYENDKQGTWLNFSMANSEIILNEGVYFGAAASISSTGDLALLQSSQETANNFQFTATADANSYIWLVEPASFGTPTFTVNGFVGGFIQNGTLNLGANVYIIYRTVNKGLGTLTVEIS